MNPKENHVQIGLVGVPEVATERCKHWRPDGEEDNEGVERNLHKKIRRRFKVLVRGRGGHHCLNAARCVCVRVGKRQLLEVYFRIGGKIFTGLEPPGAARKSRR